MAPDESTRAGVVERAARAALTGTEDDARRDVLRDPERASEIDDETRALAEHLCARIVRARDAEHTPLALADGSTMPLARAVRVLAEKEDARVFAPLSRLVAERELSVVRAPIAGGARRSDDERALALAVADETARLDDAARDVLETLGGAPVERERLSLSRALSLPRPQGAFLDERARALLRAAKEHLGRALVRPVVATRAPRFAGPLVFVDDEIVRVGVFESARARPFMALVEDGARGLLAARVARGAAPHGDALAFALAHALSSSPVRRAVLDEDKRTAESAARVVAATTALTLRAAAAMARALDDAAGEARVDARLMDDALADALGAPEPCLAFALAAPALDGAPRAGAERVHARLAAAARGAALALALKDTLDETWPLSPRLSELLADLDEEAPAPPRAASLVDLLAPLL